jgi:hypothetical protein
MPTKNQQREDSSDKASNFPTLFRKLLGKKQPPLLEPEEEPPLSFRELSESEKYKLQEKMLNHKHKENMDHARRRYNVARWIIGGYFISLILLMGMLTGLNLGEKDSSNMEQFIGSFMETGKQALIALVFFYVGKSQKSE